MKTFLSYSSADYEQVERLQEAIAKFGYDVWFAPNKIRLGDCFAKEISKALQQAEVFLLFASRHSVGDSTYIGSDEVKTEVKIARERGIPIIPINVDGVLKDGVGQGFDYLLKNYQYNLDVEAALRSKNYQQAATIINAQILNREEQEGTKCCDEQILYAEKLLKEKQSHSAYEYLSKLSLPSYYGDIVAFLKLIARIQRKNIKKISKKEADHYIKTLQELNNKDIQIPKFYLQALLSEHYYRKNGIVDPTSGVKNLRAMASQFGKLKAKYIVMTDGLIPEHTKFASLWR